MQLSTLSYIWEPLCDDVQVHSMTTHSAIRHNCRSRHNEHYLYQWDTGSSHAPDTHASLPPCPTTGPRRGGDGPALRKSIEHPLIPTSFFPKPIMGIAPPKDHTYQNQNNLPLPSHENHPSINKDSLSCVRVLYIGEKKC